MKRESTKDVDKFVRTFLRRDGMFLIRLVSKNASDVVAAELLSGLWQHYKDNRRLIEKLEFKDDDHSSARISMKPEERNHCVEDNTDSS